MSTELENILSGQGAVAPAPETRPEPQPEQPAEPQANAEPAFEGDLPADENATVSVKAVIAEREKGKKRYTEAVESFEKRMSEQAQQFEARFNQLFAQLAPKPAQPEPEQAPDIWTDPDAYLQRGVQQAVSPVMGQLKAMQRGMADMMFRDKPGLVGEAEKAFNDAANAGRLSREFIQQVNSSENPWVAAVEWHQQQTVMAEIGSDPAAYKQKLRDELKAELMAEFQQGQQPGAQRAAPVMPGNFATGRNVGARTGPAYSGPPALDDILGQRR
ncbi:hypothetical protein J2X48_000715 [Bosea sp. BE271]|uniref:hypothetical protein n=1 Tax=Bosea TaxID=85413 RepID=UPI0028594A6F|nr:MULTISPECIES: hypothetical protein [Bosea]MDR6826481.1 hypothetical protein [Bosea robiniae]MDR6893191.1 hypothetical protein [Bosea sp. BE109]MDR7137110.1 hypothetical protein [Bosea sp. BE168]MDR7173809.1 hypothetical protein [Bosea sp. BE271]